MKKAILLCLLIVSVTSLSACSNESVSRSKAKNTATTTSGTDVINKEVTSADNTNNTVTVDSTGNLIAETTNNTKPVTTTNGGVTKLAITYPSQTANHTTGSNWNVIRGIASVETAAIEVNGYRLAKFVAGSQNWNYIAAVKMETLKKGENEYVIKAFDANENVIDEMTYHINYQDGHALPNVGTNMNLILFLTLIFSLNLYILTGLKRSKKF